MKKLLATILLVALAVASRADGGAGSPSASDPAKTGQPAAAKREGTKARQKAKRADPAAKPAAEPPPKAPDPKGEKPCEPVKPCPID